MDVQWTLRIHALVFFLGLRLSGHVLAHLGRIDLTQSEHYNAFFASIDLRNDPVNTCPMEFLVRLNRNTGCTLLIYRVKVPPEGYFPLRSRFGGSRIHVDVIEILSIGNLGKIEFCLQLFNIGKSIFHRL